MVTVEKVGGVVLGEMRVAGLHQLHVFLVVVVESDKLFALGSGWIVDLDRIEHVLMGWVVCELIYLYIIITLALIIIIIICILRICEYA